MTNKTTRINKTNIESESYYNLIQLCRITGYADPIAALRQTDQVFEVTKDNCGNIISGRNVTMLHAVKVVIPCA